MQLVATINTPFEDHLSTVRKIHGFVDALRQKTARAWDGLYKSLPETAAFTSVPVRTPVGIPGYYGGAYDRLSASMPMMSCVECIAANPFPHAPTSRQSTERAPQPDGEEAPWFAVLRADLIIPAMMM